MINTAGKGITPATKVILNLVLGVFKVEVRERRAVAFAAIFYLQNMLDKEGNRGSWVRVRG